MDIDNLLDEIPMEGHSDTVFGRCIAALEETEDFQAKARIALTLGQIHRRDSFDHLINLLTDKNDIVSGHAVVGLAYLHDSRATFPLINFFYQTGHPGVQQRIVQYMGFTGDPRSEDFLRQVASEAASLEGLANACLAKVAGNADFMYDFAGREQKYNDALLEGVLEPPSPSGAVTVNRIAVTGAAALEHAAKIIRHLEEEYGSKEPQTYIIDNEGKLYIGGYINEHVDVAHAGRVRAAGEIIFEKDSLHKWSVRYANQRSYGYYPAASCFEWLKLSLKRAGIAINKDRFDEVFPRDGYNSDDFLSLQLFGKHYSGDLKVSMN